MVSKNSIEIDALGSKLQRELSPEFFQQIKKPIESQRYCCDGNESISGNMQSNSNIAFA